MGAARFPCASPVESMEPMTVVRGCPGGQGPGASRRPEACPGCHLIATTHTGAIASVKPLPCGLLLQLSGMQHQDDRKHSPGPPSGPGRPVPAYLHPGPGRSVNTTPGSSVLIAVPATTPADSGSFPWGVKGP